MNAPITIIYAPNGTGKTSFCQAAEWLLTGTVRNVDDRDLRCKQSKADLPTEVTGIARVGERLYPQLRHTSTTWALGEEERQSKILELLAPSILAEREMHHSIVIQRRREWLRGTHFLFTDSLAVLVDRDDDTMAARRRIFADILGVRHLEEACEDLRRYAEKINTSATEAERSFAQASGSLISIEAQIAAKFSAIDLTENVGSTLADVEALIGAKVKKASTELSHLESLDGLYAEACQALNISRERMSFIHAHWKRLPELQLGVEKKQAQRTLITESLIGKRTEQARLNGAIEQQVSERQGLEVRDRNIENLIDRLTVIRGEFRDSLGAALSTKTASALAKELANELGLPQRSRVARRRKLEALQSQLEAHNSSYDSLGPLLKEADYLKKKANSPTELKQWREELASQSAQLSETKQLYELASEPLQQIQEAAASLIEHLADGHECPVCSHDWKSTKALEVAMRQTLKRPLAAVRNLQVKIRQLEKSIATLRKRISDAEELRKTVDQIGTLLRDTQMKVAAFETEFEEHLGKVAAGQRREMLIAALERLLASDIYSKSLALFSEVAALTLIEPSPGLPLSRMLSAHQSALRADGDKIAGLVEAAQKSEFVSRKALDSVSADITNLASQAAGLDSQLQADAGAIQSIFSNWQALAKDSEINEEAIKEIQINLDDLVRNLDNASAKLEGARATLTARSLNIERDKFAALTKRARGRRDRLASLVAKANLLANKLDRYSRSLAWSKLEGLMPIAQTLFARMHANKVFDKVHPKSKEAPLDWLADTGNLKVNPQTVFSHGQRQDFALSLFLAKACVHGGTYILDEPVAHLDDLNRVAVLDVFRVLAITSKQHLKLVVTTSSRSLA
ncbi:MAG: hypothetical protein EOP09_03810, partial [Proteobacteria bacterium]